MEPLGLILSIALALGLGLVLGWLLARRASTAGMLSRAVADAEREAAVQSVRAEQERARSEMNGDLAALAATADAMREQLLGQQAQYQQLLDTQRGDRAREAERARLDREAQAEKDQADSRVLQALAPVGDRLGALARTVEELESRRAQQHGEIAERLKLSAESEERLRATTASLASALRSNSTRGVWGETQLRRVVEAAGLIERVDFDVQTSMTTEQGVQRPDMVVHLPGGKHIAVDAKVPFSAHLEAEALAEATDPASRARRDALLRDHVKAVRDHVTALGRKEYWSGLGTSPELVIAFIPSESLVSSALEADRSLMEYAFSQRVALASPVTLWSVLKTVAFSWQQDVLTSEARQLFDLSRELHQRLATTAKHIDKLGRSIDRGVKDYNAFLGSLERQVLPSARKLSALDESKVLPALTGIEEGPRGITAPELVAALDAEYESELESERGATLDTAPRDNTGGIAATTSDNGPAEHSA